MPRHKAPLLGVTQAYKIRTNHYSQDIFNLVRETEWQHEIVNSGHHIIKCQLSGTYCWWIRSSEKKKMLWVLGAALSRLWVLENRWDWIRRRWGRGCLRWEPKGLSVPTGHPFQLCTEALYRRATALLYLSWRTLGQFFYPLSHSGLAWPVGPRHGPPLLPQGDVLRAGVGGEWNHSLSETFQAGNEEFRRWLKI